MEKCCIAATTSDVRAALGKMYGKWSRTVQHLNTFIKVRTLSCRATPSIEQHPSNFHLSDVDFFLSENFRTCNEFSTNKGTMKPIQKYGNKSLDRFERCNVLLLEPLAKNWQTVYEF